MSVAAVTWALYEVRDLPGAEKLILVMLGESASADGTGAWPSWARISEVCGVSRATVGRLIASLDNRGLIRRGDQSVALDSIRRRGGDVRHCPTVWDLVMDGSHVAAAQQGLTPVGAEDREPEQQESPQVDRGLTARPLDDEASAPDADRGIAAGRQGSQNETPNLPDPSRVAKGSHIDPLRRLADETQTKDRNQLPTTTTERAGDSPASPSNPLVVEADGSIAAARSGMTPSARGIAQAIRSRLPPAVGEQLTFAVLARRSEPLAAAGWSADQAGQAAGTRSWDGAGPGAVIAWVTGLTAEDPPTLHIEVPRAERLAHQRAWLAKAAAERAAAQTPEATSARAWALAEVRRMTGGHGLPARHGSGGSDLPALADRSVHPAAGVAG